MDLLPTLSPLVVEDLKPRPTQHPEALQERAEEARSAKVRAVDASVARDAWRRRGCLGAAAAGATAPKGGGSAFCTGRRADAPRAASRRRAGVQLSAVREASKDVPPIGTRKAEGAADGAPRPPHRAARGSAARCASRPLLAPAAASSCARCGDDARADAPAPASFVVRSPRPRRPCLKDADRSGALHPPWRATCLPVLQRGASDLR